MILAATGIHSALILLGMAFVITLVWHNGMIEQFGPIRLQPSLPVMVAVPMLLAVACGISHVAPRTPVIFRNRRTFWARALSHATVLVAGLAILAVGDALAVNEVFGPSLRNALFLSGVALAASALAGVAYAWVPVVVVFGVAVLSPADEATWSVYALVMAPTAEAVQIIAGAGVCLAGLALAAWDPFDRAYLRRAAPRD